MCEDNKWDEQNKKRNKRRSLRYYCSPVCGDKPHYFLVVCPQNGTAVLEGFNPSRSNCGPVLGRNRSKSKYFLPERDFSSLPQKG